MPDDTPWMNDPDFKNLPLPEKHKFLLQADPDYKGLPAKEQAKALDVIHYGTLGQISGTGDLTQGAGTSFLNTIKSAIPPDPTGGAPILSKKFWLGDNTVKIHPSQGGIAQAGKEVQAEYQRARQAGAGPLAAGFSGGVAGAGSLAGVSNINQMQQAEQGESGQILGESAAPAAIAATGPLFGKLIPRSFTSRIAERAPSPLATATPGSAITGTNAPIFDITPSDWALSPKKSALKYAANKAARLVGAKGSTVAAQEAAGEQAAAAGKAANELEQQYRDAAAKESKVVDQGESPAEIQKALQQRRAAYAEMQEDFANRAKQQEASLQKRLDAAEKARQKEITDWAKVDKVNEADHQAFEDRMNEIEAERQKSLADLERFKQQHAESLMQRGRQQTAMDNANAQRLADIEKARQGDLAAQERLKEQHAAALNARQGPKAPRTSGGAIKLNPFEGMTSTRAPIGNAPLPEVPQGSPTPFPQLNRPGSMPPPPLPAAQPSVSISERPTVGSQVAARQKTSVLSVGKQPIPLGVEPDMSNPVHAKIINDEIGQGINARKLAELRTRAKLGDRFAGYLVDYWARNR